MAAVDEGALRANRGEPTVTWVGHSTLLVQLEGVNVLTDPQWSERASPVGFAGPRRVTPPGVAFEALPPIHVVVISHDHYDHLDLPTVKRLAAAHRPRFFVPLGMKAWFAENGIDEVDELDWWESRQVRGLTVTCGARPALEPALAVGPQPPALERLGRRGPGAPLLLRR